MATRSTIAVVMPNGTVKQVYAHWDGYISHNGRILGEFYNTFEAAAALVELGDISVLAERIIPSGKHSFDTPEKGCTIFYGRDRAEPGTGPRSFRNVKQFMQDRQVEEFNYLFINGDWLVHDEYNNSTERLVVLLTEEEDA